GIRRGREHSRGVDKDRVRRNRERFSHHCGPRRGAPERVAARRWRIVRAAAIAREHGGKERRQRDERTKEARGPMHGGGPEQCWSLCARDHGPEPIRAVARVERPLVTTRCVVTSVYSPS